MAAATGYHCGRCGQKTDSAGVVHTDTKGNTFTPDHASNPLVVASNWPLIRS